MTSRLNLEGEAPTATTDHTEFEKQLPDNCVNYLLFSIDAKQAPRQLSQLESIRKSASQLSSSIAKGYIWQRDEFNIELKNEEGK